MTHNPLHGHCARIKPPKVIAMSPANKIQTHPEFSRKENAIITLKTPMTMRIEAMNAVRMVEANRGSYIKMPPAMR